MKEYISINYHHILIEMLLKATVVGSLAVNILTPILLSIILIDIIDHEYLLFWISVNVVIFVLRVFLIHKTKAANKLRDKSVNKFLYSTFGLIFISSLLHALALVYSSFYVSDLQLLFIAVITISLVSGSIATLGSIYHAFAIYVISNLLPIWALFLYKGGEIFYSFSLAVFVYMFVMLKNGYVMYSALVENIMLKETLEQRVKESTAIIEDMLGTSMIMVAFQDEQGVMTDMNQAALDRFGYDSREEIVGISMLNFIPEKSIPIVQEALKHDSSEPYELIMKKKDGTEFPTLISAKYVLIDSQRIRMTTMMDLTELKEKEKLLQQQSRLAQMGEMISMIAHQWRQPLSAISATSTAMILRTKLGTIDNEYVEEMSNNISGYATHLSETINDFRNFYKPNKEKIEISLDTLFESVYSIIKISLKKHNIKLIQELHSKEETLSYANELKQVLLNLIKNAEDILIEREIENPYIIIHTYTDKGRRFLEIKDNGGGIDSSIIDKIFDPYFSTKKKKDGTGLGLYMSKVIVEDHCNGVLSVENTEEGAMFCIELGTA